MKFEKIAYEEIKSEHGQPPALKKLPPKLALQRTVINSSMFGMLMFGLFVMESWQNEYNHGFTIKQVLAWWMIAFAFYAINFLTLFCRASGDDAPEVYSEDVSPGYTVWIAFVALLQLVASGICIYCWYMLEYSVAVPVKLFPMTLQGF